MLITIDTDKLEEVIPYLRAVGYDVNRRRFFRGIPPPFGRGEDITHLVTFDNHGAPIFPEAARV